MDRIPPGELTLEQLDALVAEGRVGLARYWQLREHIEHERHQGADDRSYDLPVPPDQLAAGGPGFVPPPPRRPGALPPHQPPPPLVPPPPPAGQAPAGWVRLPIAGPTAEAGSTRADDSGRRGRSRRRRPRD